MSEIIDTLLLLALPASGKSEVRKYMDHLDPEQGREQLHMGPTVQLDDFPYVHLMHRIDDELKAAGGDYVYYRGPHEPAQDPVFWGLLIELLNEDHADLLARTPIAVDSAAEWLLDRLEAATERAGGAPRLAGVPAGVRAAAAAKLEAECRALLDEKLANYPDSLEGRTVVIEFARGGPEGAAMPLTGYLGYQYALAHLSPAILERAAILYIWVTPEESRRKNDARADPNDPGSILHHGVPEVVMRGDYGCDDIEHLMAAAGQPDTITVTAHGTEYRLPIGRFDNRVDKTSQLRGDPDTWDPAGIADLHAGLASAMAAIARGYFQKA